MAPADVRLGVGYGLGRGLAPLQFQFIKARPQHLPRLFAVLVLRSARLTGHHGIGRSVRQTHRRVRLVDVLTTRARGAVGVGAHVRRIDVDLDGVVHHRRDTDRGEGRVPLGCRVIGADAHQPVHARFRLQPTVGVRPGDQDGGRLDAGLVARFLGLQLDLIAVGPRPAAVHSQQHPGPVTGLGAAGTGVHLKIGVITVSLARQQRLQLGSPGALLDGLQRAARLFQRRLVAFLVGHVGEHDTLLQTGFHLADGVNLGGQPRPVA